VVLGDRIEALAGASAASIAGVAVCHIHGGDRAEGIADEAMRHAITKLAHVHCAATAQSRERIIKLGERPEHVFNTGSPAIDRLDKIKPMRDAEAKELGDPRMVMLLHPSGLTDTPTLKVPQNLGERLDATILGQRRPAAGKTISMALPQVVERENHFAALTFIATSCLRTKAESSTGWHISGLLLHPNHDPGHEQILARWHKIARFTGWPIVPHLPREKFISLLKRLRMKGGLLVGNSSAGLIECAYLGVVALNVGPRQAGRERGPNVVDADPLDTVGVVRKVRKAEALAGKLKPSNLFGDGRAGVKIAAILAKLDPHEPALIRKRNTY
jgi:UDP-N-acetylglucosamine 2-epimerase